MKTNHEKPPPTMPGLPMDIIVDIFRRLPVKTLLRFRCLSKQFRSIIDDPCFINRHLQCHSLDQKLILQGSRPNLLLLDLDSVGKASKLDPPFEDLIYFVDVIGSCDGLLALVINAHDIGLWNISTKKHQILPKFCSDFNVFFDDSYGFGRDATTDDYKLVRIENHYRINFTKVSVFSLKANCWRRIDGFPPYSRYRLREEAAVVEGTLNWLGELEEVEDRAKDFIVSFDLTNESLSEVVLPDTIREVFETTLYLTNLRGCLGFLYAYRDEPIYDIWIMKEYGLKDSWTKLYSFSYQNPEIPSTPPTYEGVEDALVCSMHGDKIFIVQILGQVFKIHGKVFRYDLEEKKFEIFKINGLPDYIKSVHIYVESLVSPKVNN